MLTDIADGKKEERAADRIAAMKVLADTGGVDKIAITFDEQPEEAPVTAKDVAETWGQLEQCRTIEQLEKTMVDHAKKKVVPALYRRYRGL